MKDTDLLKEDNTKYMWCQTAFPAGRRINASQIRAEGSGVLIADPDAHEIVDAVSSLWNENLGCYCDAMHPQPNASPCCWIFGCTVNDVLAEVGSTLRGCFEPDAPALAFHISGGNVGVGIALRPERRYHSLGGEQGRTKRFGPRMAATACTREEPR